MKRYVSARRSVNGVTAVTVSLVDGGLSARWSTKTYVGSITDATSTCEGYARRALEEMKRALEESS